MMNIITVSQISKKYGNLLNSTKALNGVSFNIEKGDFVGIMGPSGSGKTTLLNIISSAMKPDVGEIIIDGKELTRMKENEVANFRKNHLGFIFQDFNLLESLTVEENIILPLTFSKFKKVEITKRLQYINKILGLTPLNKRRIDELSGGQKQLVACARAIINKPEVLFADEPTGSLDSKSATQLLNYLEKINTQEQTTILMATHDAFTASYCKRIIFIKDGKIFAKINTNGDRKEFFEKIINMQRTIGGGDFFNA
ncbi:ABC transporter ATP-binding protein [Companilactobacillus sp. DQM5]|uniref:ABC transporter ATP-binding protein n=1 Tax=Companilactobacillus sp. DQM5 TaxID=3463359 RepID=UPI0040591D58